jgi:2,3-dihydroxy-2,3-dihydrophenylpropionate dehydrogenase
VHDGGLSLDAPAATLVAGTQRVLSVDVLGYLLALNAAAAALRSSGGAVVMTLSDASYLAGQTGAGIAYTAAKHAQAGVLAWAARWFAPDVRVNAVAPGGVLTDLREAVGGAPLFTDPEAKRASIASRNPLGTVLTADEVAAYYTWLAGPRAVGLTGQVVRPDGGLSVR